MLLMFSHWIRGAPGAPSMAEGRVFRWQRSGPTLFFQQVWHQLAPVLEFLSILSKSDGKGGPATGAFNLKRTTPVLNSLRSDSHLINARWEGKERQRRVFKPLSRNKRCEMETLLNWHVVARCWWKCLAFGEECSSSIFRHLFSNWICWGCGLWEVCGPTHGESSE